MKHDTISVSPRQRNLKWGNFCRDSPREHFFLSVLVSKLSSRPTDKWKWDHCVGGIPYYSTHELIFFRPSQEILLPLCEHIQSFLCHCKEWSRYIVGGLHWPLLRLHSHFNLMQQLNLQLDDEIETVTG